jgi:hypothetical protein
MALEGPRLVYTRKEEEAEPLDRALKLARQIEEVLDETVSDRVKTGATRIVRAMASSLVDELEAIVHGTRKSAGLS